MMSVALNTNLLVNGDAEIVPPPPMPVPAQPLVPLPPPGPVVKGWRTFGAFEAVRYGERGMPSLASPGPGARGNMLFAGGMSETASATPDTSGAVQFIDISSIAADVDAGRISFNFSAFLGGYGFEKDSMRATLVFNNGMLIPPMGPAVMLSPPPGPYLVSPTPAKRKGVTGLMEARLGGDVPVGTRAIAVQLLATKTYGKYIDGFADNVELKLSSSMPMNQGVVAGRVMNDANGNGRLDLGELGVPNALVFSDRNQNGNPDAGEPSATTDAAGAYSMQTAPGLNVIRQVPPAGFRSTGALVRKVMVEGGLTTTGHSFLASQTGVITGSTFEDWNGNGKRDKGDEPLTAVDVFLDINKNGKFDKGEPRTMTDRKGNFSFVAPAGTYTIRQREPAALFKQTLPAKGKGIVVKLAAGATSKGSVFCLRPIPQ